MILLVGSALCGLAQGMVELILFRALQGLGAGGLIVVTLAVVGDIISLRQRGRYHGYFGVVAVSRRAQADEQQRAALAFYREVGATRHVREGEALLAASA